MTLTLPPTSASILRLCSNIAYGNRVYVETAFSGVYGFVYFLSVRVAGKSVVPVCDCEQVDAWGGFLYSFFFSVAV